MASVISERLQALTPKPTRPVRLSSEALRLAKIAVGYTQESIAVYASRAVCERALSDIAKLQKLPLIPPEPEKKLKRKRAGRGETPGS